jgi:hypothetical protein
MTAYFAKLAALAAVAAPFVFAAPAPHAGHLKIRNADVTDVVPDSYIVVYHNDINATAIAAHVDTVSSMLSKRDTDGIGATYDLSELKGYQVQADSATIAEIAASPEVRLT